MMEEPRLPDRSNTGGEAPIVPAVSIETLDRKSALPPVAFAFIVLAVVFVLYQGLGAVITYLMFGVNVTTENVNMMRWTSVIGQFLFMLVPSIALARARGWKVASLFRITMPTVWEIVLVIISVMALQIVLQVYLIGQDWILEHFFTPASLKPFIDQIKKMINDLYTKLVFAHSPLELLFVVLVIGVTPALCEESLFRGVVQGAFEKGMKPFWAIVLCGSIFASFHLNPFAFIPLAILGIYFSFIVWRGNSIVLAVIAHFFNNSLAAVLLYALGTDAVMIPMETGSDMNSSVLLANLLGGTCIFIIATFIFWKLTAKRLDPRNHSSEKTDEVLPGV